MSIKYIVRRDLLEIEDGVTVSDLLRTRLIEAEKQLETDPRPNGCKSIKDGGFKIWVTDGNEEVVVIYKIVDKTREIFLVRIEAPSLIRKAIGAIDDLLNFGP